MRSCISLWALWPSRSGGPLRTYGAYARIHELFCVCVPYVPVVVLPDIRIPAGGRCRFLRGLIGGCCCLLSLGDRIVQDRGIHVADGDLEVVVFRIQGDGGLNLNRARAFLGGAWNEDQERFVEGGDMAVIGHRHHQPGHAEVLRL